MPSTLRRGAVALLVAAAAAALLPAAAGAHIQVSPALVAPNDPVKITVLVPGERSADTTRVELKMPADLLPFSYEETPGWKRQLIKASNGAIDRVVWTGRSPSDGFVEFSFLAGTPEKPGRLVFKALQTYSDRTIVRWIGAPGADQPAPVTRVEEGAPRQNVGGEGEGGKPAASTGGSATAAAGVASGGDHDSLALVLGGAGLLLGLVALTVAVRAGRRERTPA